MIITVNEDPPLGPGSGLQTIRSTDQANSPEVDLLTRRPDCGLALVQRPVAAEQRDQDLVCEGGNL